MSPPSAVVTDTSDRPATGGREVEFLRLATPDPPSVVPPRVARVGDILIELGFANRATVESAVSEARKSGEPIGERLLERGAITTDQLAIAMAKRFGLEHRLLEEITLDPTAAALVSFAAARRFGAVPVGIVGDNVLIVAVANPENYIALEDVSMFTGMAVRQVVVSREDLDTLLGRLGVLDGEMIEDGGESTAQPTAAEVAALESADDAPTIRLVRTIISDAVDRGASDIHFAPDDGAIRVRYRIDGVMSDAAQIPRGQALAVISRIKILADLDISERRLPQDGRIGILVDGRRVDIRVAVVPLVSGESAVLRILDAGRSPLTLDDLGMTLEDRTRLSRPLHSAHGGILATGPTGCGKTTTLYALIGLVASSEKTITTIEDPVEYRLPGVSQIQVAGRTGLTFATGLRAIVRADPDVIMVGEIRDRESAHIAVDAALTGHLVLSTLHTNDAPSAPLRLIDMGIEPYLVAASINCVIAQRLARKVCTTCRRAVAVAGEEVGLDAAVKVEVFEAVGCPRCRRTGYRGRLGLFEVMDVTDEIRTLIVGRAPAHEIADKAVAQGMHRLHEDGLAKVRTGETTLAEIERVLG